MDILDIKQGSPEWLALRLNYFTASEAPAMMGDSPFTTRDQLLHQKKTGSTPEVSEYQQKKFDAGHKAEDKARPLAEAIVGSDLFPATGVTNVAGLPLLASFDGLTMMEDRVFEHKLWNEKLVVQIEGEGLEPAYYWQLEHQLLVSGAECVLFICSDGSPENLRHVYYYSQDHRRDALIAGWQQFKADLETFQPLAPEPVLEGEIILDTTALVIQIAGQVNHSNLPRLEQQIWQTIDSTKSALVTDQDFANAESAVKYFKKTEKKLQDGKDTALAQVPDIARLFAKIDQLTDAMASKRKSLDKQVKHQKQHIKDRMVLDAMTALEKTRHNINKTLQPALVPQAAIPADFQEVIKGKKSFISMHSAINDRLAQARIELKRKATVVQQNLTVYQKLAVDKDYLFPDLNVLLHKDQPDLIAIIEMRLNQEQQQIANNEQPEPAPVAEPKPEKKDAQQARLSPQGEAMEEIITDDIHTMEKWVGKSALNCSRFDHAGNEYHLELIIRRTGIKTPTTQRQLKEA